MAVARVAQMAIQQPCRLQVLECVILACSDACAVEVVRKRR